MKEYNCNQRTKWENLKRGDIVFTILPNGEGSEQQGERPMMIIQNDIGNKFSPTLILASVTSQIKKLNMPTHVFIPKYVTTGLEKDSMLEAEQIKTLDKIRITRYIGRIKDKETMDKIDEAVQVSLGLINKMRNILNRKKIEIEKLDYHIYRCLEMGISIKELGDDIGELKSYVKDFEILCKKNDITDSKIELYYEEFLKDNLIMSA